MDKSTSYFEEDIIIDYLTQILIALNYCHKRNVLHRDIKPQNIFLTKNNQLCLGDFGLCREIRHDISLVSSVGTDYYKSPEMLKGGNFDGKKSDVF